MTITQKLAATSAGLALAISPAAALAHTHSGSAPGQAKKTTSTSSTTTPAPTPSQREAYGKMCQGESKDHVAGTPGTGTPFSQCVRAMARMEKSPKLNAHKACAGLSKSHVKAQKGTPFSECIVAANRLRQSEHKSSTGSTASTTSTTSAA